ncbi:FecR family protein [Dyadobacter subterraneus]|uniref:FecR domain-containing protein n=1 Tax=Dyadobacter subterraneus TaxID=2773304 RepID=A0ABR9W5H8_9BACT|nr:FecR domain-containing protein [Dyadobacter subterraneus]MBE9460703.1 FecR domain-containing protein [Dyadobacter subterraneus]
MEESLKHILFEYLSGRANPLERQLAEDWLKNTENTEVFHQWLLEWETRSPQFIPDQEKAMNRLLERINQDNQDLNTESENESSSDISFNPLQIQKYWLIAASVLLLVCWGWLSRDLLLYKTFETGYGKTTQIYLEDGSSVALNANSRLKIPRFGFYGDVRNVILDGEAEFSVSHTIDHKRFVVKTSDTFQVEVLGTQFSVFARPRGTKVALSRGKIRIDYAQGNEKQQLLMKPGDLVTLEKTGELKLTSETDIKNNSAWKEQRFIFNATSVMEISAMINENFGRKIIIANEKIARRTITGNFKTESADELLKTISEVLDLRVETAGNSILITEN